MKTASRGDGVLFMTRVWDETSHPHRATASSFVPLQGGRWAKRVFVLYLRSKIEHFFIR